MLDQRRNRFEKQAASRRPGLVAELIEFVVSNKKWWLIPILAVLLVLSGLVLLSSTAVAPFIYTLF